MNARALAKVLKGAGGHLPGVGPALYGLGHGVEQLGRGNGRQPPLEGKREVHMTAGYRVVVWLERGFATAPHLYVAVERRGYFGIARAPSSPPAAETWQHVRTWADVQVAPAPWWQPWRRKHELCAVIEQAITFVDTQENLETTAQATLEAVTEAMRLT